MKKLIRVKRGVLSIAVEFLLWLALPLLYLSFYFFGYGVGVGAVLAHLFLVLVLWLGSVALRLLNWRFGGVLGGRGQRLVGSVFFLLPTFFLAFWYLLSFLSLESWGQNVTWPLLTVYFGQLWFLVDVLGVGMTDVVLMVFGVVFFFVAGYQFLYSVDWCRGGAKRLTSSGLLLVAFSALCLVVCFAFNMRNYAHDNPQEPISAGFYPVGSPTLQTHAFVAPRSVADAEAAQRSAYLSMERFTRRNVVLIVADALRSDHMGVYGYHRSTTPFLEDLVLQHDTYIAKEARAVCAESFCGLTAIASSRPWHLTPNKPITLHEVLRLNGYRVEMILSGDHTNFYGLKDIYGAVDSYFDGTHQSSRYVNDDLLVLSRVSDLPVYDGDVPVFFQFHLMSVHGLGKRKEDGFFGGASNYYKWSSVNPRVAAASSDVPLAVNYYDYGVKSFDEVVSKILNQLQVKGYLDNTLIVIAGDHGEMLGEHAAFGHQHGVEESVLRIPLILQRRGYSGERFKKWPLATQVDIAPTILKELGITKPEVWVGAALQNHALSRIVDFQQGARVGFYDVDSTGNFLKYWMDSRTGEEFVFDVQNDPGESSNMINSMDSNRLMVWRREIMNRSIGEQQLFTD